MLLDLTKRELICLVRGCEPSYEQMDIPIIRTLGYYYGGHSDEWTWNYGAFDGMSELQIYEVYKILQNPPPEKKVYWRKGPCTINELHAKLKSLAGVEYVYIEDHLDLSVTVTVVGGTDSEIADVLAESLMSCVRTLGDYQVQATGPMGWKFLIKRCLG